MMDEIGIIEDIVGYREKYRRLALAELYEYMRLWILVLVNAYLGDKISTAESTARH
jgi:hypothetical protein